MKGGCVAGLPVLCAVSPFRLRGGPVEWRGGVCGVLSPCLVLSLSSSWCSPVFELDLALRIVRSSLALHSFVLCCLLLLCIVVLCAENGRLVCVVSL